MKRKATFVVLTERTASLFDSRYPHYAEAHTAQEAVNSVRRYKADDEKIVAVFKKVENWK